MVVDESPPLPLPELSSIIVTVVEALPPLPELDSAVVAGVLSPLLVGTVVGASSDPLPEPEFPPDPEPLPALPPDTLPDPELFDT